MQPMDIVHINFELRDVFLKFPLADKTQTHTSFDDASKAFKYWFWFLLIAGHMLPRRSPWHNHLPLMVADVPSLSEGNRSTCVSHTDGVHNHSCVWNLQLELQDCMLH